MALADLTEKGRRRRCTAPDGSVHGAAPDGTRCRWALWRRPRREDTVKRYHYDRHDQLRQHLQDFIDAYNFDRRLKTLKGLTPDEYICKCWTSQPDRFIINPIHQMPGLST